MGFKLLPGVFLLLLTTAQLASGDDDVTIHSLQTLVQQQVASIQSLQARVVSLESTDRLVANTVQQHTSQLSALTAMVNNQVYFTAHMSDSQHPVHVGTSNTPFKFDDVVTNFGNAYNPQTGVFTAPVSGVYVFYVQMMKHDNGPETTFIMQKGGAILCMNSLDDGNNYDKSTCLVTTHMQRGETVFVTRYSGSDFLQGWWYCAFSGFLLSPDAN